MTSGETRKFVIRIVCGGEIGVVTEVGAKGDRRTEHVRCEFMSGPSSDMKGGVEAEEIVWAGGELLIREGAGGESEAIGRGESGGLEGEEENAE